MIKFSKETLCICYTDTYIFLYLFKPSVFHCSLSCLPASRSIAFRILHFTFGLLLANRILHFAFGLLLAYRILHFTFDLLHRIQIKCGTGNIRSKKIPQRLHFQLEGIERDGELLSGEQFTDLETYSLLNDRE